MKESRALSTHGALLLAGLVAVCLLAAGAAAALRPPSFASHEETVAYVLESQGIAYEQVRVIATWTGLLHRDAYAASIAVQLADGREVPGSLECQVNDSKCALHIGQLGIAHELVPELTSRPPWFAWLKQQLLRFTRSR